MYQCCNCILNADFVKRERVSRPANKRRRQARRLNEISRRLRGKISTIKMNCMRGD
jgi:hypothetical protein